MKYNEKQIIEAYLKGTTAKAIAANLGTYNTTIRRILIRNNIRLRSISEVNSCVKAERFIAASEIRDYWLGFLAADGYVGDSTNVVDIICAEKDMLHLQKFAEWLGVPLRKYVHKKFKVLQIVVRFKNANINRYLKDIGITPRKSETLCLNIPLNKDIFRGVLDGDGYVRVVNSHRAVVEIATKSIIFAYQLSYFLKQNDINISSINTRKDGLHLVCLYKKAEVTKLYYLLYTDASIFLERKKDRMTATLL